MADDDNGIPREQLVLRHISDSDGDWLVEVGKDNPCRWHSVVEEKTLTLSSVNAFVGRSFSQGGYTEGADAIVDGDSAHSLTLTGVSRQADDGTKVYGIDVSEGDPEYLIAQRVDTGIGIDLIGRSPEEFYEGSLKTPYTSEVFVSTDGWYYGDAESVQLLFDIPARDLQELYKAVSGGHLDQLRLTVSVLRWVYVDLAAPNKEVTPARCPVLYGYIGDARLLGWESQSRFP